MIRIGYWVGVSYYCSIVVLWYCGGNSGYLEVAVLVWPGQGAQPPSTPPAPAPATPAVLRFEMPHKDAKDAKNRGNPIDFSLYGGAESLRTRTVVEQPQPGEQV